MKKLILIVGLLIGLISYSQERIYILTDSTNKELVKFKNKNLTYRKLDSVYFSNPRKYKVLKIESFIENVPNKDREWFICTYRRKINFNTKSI